MFLSACPLAGPRIRSVAFQAVCYTREPSLLPSLVHVTFRHVVICQSRSSDLSTSSSLVCFPSSTMHKYLVRRYITAPTIMVGAVGRTHLFPFHDLRRFVVELIGRHYGRGRSPVADAPTPPKWQVVLWGCADGGFLGPLAGQDHPLTH